MKTKFIPKFNPGNRKKNTLVKLTILAHDKNKYKCVGVLMKEDDKALRVGFNAMNNTVVDYLDIETKQIVDMKPINPKDIKVLE